MPNRPYYSFRTGRTSRNIGIIELRILFKDIYEELFNKGYFAEMIGWYDYEGDFIPGKIEDMEKYIFRQLYRNGIWPIKTKHLVYSEDDVFNLIELLYDLVSERSWDDRSKDYIINKQKGQAKFQEEFNNILKDYKDGYELIDNGEISLIGNPELNQLLNANIPTYDEDNVENKVKLAVSKFRNRHSSRQDRKEAVRELADILEFLRPKVKEILTSKDEQDLFNIANNFGIRHFNEGQKTDYNINFLTWIFYCYLATIHFCLRSIKKE